MAWSVVVERGQLGDRMMMNGGECTDRGDVIERWEEGERNGWESVQQFLFELVTDRRCIAWMLFRSDIQKKGRVAGTD